MIYILYYEQSGRLRRNQASAEDLLLKSCLGHLFLIELLTFGMLYLPQCERQKHALHLRNLFLSSISKDSTLHLVPVHCVRGQIHVNVDLLVTIGDTC